MKHLALVIVVLLPLMVSANEGYEKMEALDGKVKNLLLTRAIAAHALACETVVKSISQGMDENGDGYWTAYCAEGEAYSIRVSNNDQAGVHVSLCSQVLKGRLPCSEDTSSLASD